MVRIRNVGTNHGDCFFIEIESGIYKNTIMIDGRKGDQKSFEKIKDVILEYGRIDYLIVTHIDNDHINGILKIFELPKSNDVRQVFKDTIILYNYVTKPVISYRQAEKFEKLIRKNTVVSTVKNNYKQYSSPCLKILSAVQRKYLDPREQEDFENYAVMTLLHPHKEGIEKIYKDYQKHPDKSNTKLANKNSIAFLLEYGKWVALFTGDCYMKDIVDEIDQLRNMQKDGNGRKINVVKVPHHGAKKNNERLAEFAKNHSIRDFIVTGPEKWDGSHPSINILSELEEIVNDTPSDQIVLHTHTDISVLKELNHIISDDSDIIEWGKKND